MADKAQATTPTTTEPPKPERLLRLAGVEHVTGLKKSCLYALMKKGEFPACVRITSRHSAWPESKVLAWVHERIAKGAKA
jgi:prophage regulatory protein